MFIFTFKVTLSSNAEQKTHIGTWESFEDKYPGAWLVAPVEPVIED